jgi:hypothetical protein
VFKFKFIRSSKCHIIIHPTVTNYGFSSIISSKFPIFPFTTHLLIPFDYFYGDLFSRKLLSFCQLLQMVIMCWIIYEKSTPHPKYIIARLWSLKVQSTSSDLKWIFGRECFEKYGESIWHINGFHILDHLGSFFNLQRI